MRLAILRSTRQEPRDWGVREEYLQGFDTKYADRVIGNLESKSSFCTSCGPDCTSCRVRYERKHEGKIACVADLPHIMPYALEVPGQYVPVIAEHDILLAIHVHEQVLLEVLKRASEYGTRGVVVPMEAPGWVSHSARRQAAEICEKAGVEISFPEPFCAFEPPRGSVLDSFRYEFHIGCPDVSLEIEQGVIKHAGVHSSAACGATHYICRWLEGRALEDDLELEVIGKRLHTYPCTASMERDEDLDGETPLHIAGDNHKRILEPFREVSSEDYMIMSPTGKMVQRAVSPWENVENVEDARGEILEMLRKSGPAKMGELRKNASVIAAMNTALLLLKKDGLVTIDAGVVSLVSPKQAD